MVALARKRPLEGGRDATLAASNAYTEARVKVAESTR